MQGTSPGKEKAQRLLKRIENGIKKNKVDKTNRLYDEVKKAEKELKEYISGKDKEVEVDPYGLSVPAKGLTGGRVCDNRVKCEGLKKNGQLKPGYKFAKGGDVVKVRKKKVESKGTGLAGSYEPPKNPTVEETLDFAEKNLYDKSIYHSDIGKQIVFTKSGIKKAISGKGKISKIRLQLVYLAIPLLKSSRLITHESDKKKRKQIKRVYKLAAFHFLNGIEYKIFFVLREGENGVIYYEHNGVKIKKRKGQTGGGLKKPKPTPVSTSFSLSKNKAIKESQPKPKKTVKKRSKPKNKGLKGPVGDIVKQKAVETVSDIAKHAVKEVTKTAAPQKPNSTKKPLSAKAVAAMKFDTMKLSGEWGRLMQGAPQNLKIALFWKPKNGKTTGLWAAERIGENGNGSVRLRRSRNYRKHKKTIGRFRAGCPGQCFCEFRRRFEGIAQRYSANRRKIRSGRYDKRLYRCAQRPPGGVQRIYAETP